MMVLFVSRSEKKALLTARKILDNFADRIGTDTWQTVITAEGLATVKSLLRRNATKNMAVACHWIRSRSRSELVWIVGNRSKFNERGIVPVNSTQKDLLHSDWENEWEYLPQIQALAAVAALLHDWGKANNLFQKKLCGKIGNTGDPYRHEWVSCLLLGALVHTSADADSDGGWLGALSDGNINTKKIVSYIKNNPADKLPNLPPIAKLVTWLIMSHHLLPLTDDDAKNAYLQEDMEWRGADDFFDFISAKWGYVHKSKNDDDNKKNYGAKTQLLFSKGLLCDSAVWSKAIQKWSGRLLREQETIQKIINDNALRPVLQYARLSLMLGDYYVSAGEAEKNWTSEQELYANTDKKSGELKQKLDEHLCRVCQQTLLIAKRLPRLAERMERAQDVRGLTGRSRKEFAWQDDVARKIAAFRHEQMGDTACGWFVVNVAGTGCGKTIGNAKIMRALSEDGESLRYVLALGLRSLTLQTGHEYRDRIGLDEDELAVVIGEAAFAELYDKNGKQTKNGDEESEYIGSADEELFTAELDYRVEPQDDFLNVVFAGNRNGTAKQKAFLYKPVLVTTIDHIMPATEGKRGGKYMLPFLRLLTSDLVIDEVDDFSPGDFTAIARVVHLAGMLGRNVVISSATIPPDLAYGLFQAYFTGREAYRVFTGRAKPTIGVWCDEFQSRVEMLRGADDVDVMNMYQNCHTDFIRQRLKKLAKQPARRMVKLVACDNTPCEATDTNEEREEKIADRYYAAMLQTAIDLHCAHGYTDKLSGKKISFGLMRVAHIETAVALTLFLLRGALPNGTDLRVMAYHSRQVLLLRHEQEKYLDCVLKRNKRGVEELLKNDNVIRGHVEQTAAQNLLFVVVATPVEEIGRDHDFDWAVVEPSSYRSLIQLAGRVLRHRAVYPAVPNIAVMRYNMWGLLNGDNAKKPVFCRPGYEIKKYLLQSHDLQEITDAAALAAKIDAAPRLERKDDLHPTTSLIDLEHQVTADWRDMTATGPDTLHGSLAEYWWLTALPQKLTEFRQSFPQVDIYLRYEDGEVRFYRKSNSYGQPDAAIETRLNLERIDLTPEECSRLWLKRDYVAALERVSINGTQADTEQEYAMQRDSKKYGTLAVPKNYIEDYAKLYYNDNLGMFHVKHFS